MPYILDPNSQKIAFEFDCELSEDTTLNIDWTEYPIEEGQDVSSYGWTKPENYSLSGMLTAYPLDKGYDEQVPIKAYEALRTLAKKKQPVSLISKYWSPTVVIESVKGNADSDSGDVLKASITFKTFSLPKVTYSNVPPSKLKRSVRRSASPKKKTGSQSGKTATGKNATKGQSAISKAFQSGRAASGV